MDAIVLLEQIKQTYIQILGRKLVGIYVHGSLAFDSFQTSSDIDFLVVVNQKLTLEDKVRLISILLDYDDYAPEKGFEMSVVLDSVCKNFVYPTPYELHYSNRYRSDFKMDLIGMCEELRGTDKDLALHFAVTKKVGKVLYGLSVDELFDEVDRKYILDSMQYDLHDVYNCAKEDPVYYLLNVCRGCAYVQENVLLSKLDGVKWAMEHFPERFRLLLSMARDSYVKGDVFNWGMTSVNEIIGYALDIILPKDEKYVKTRMLSMPDLPMSLHDEVIIGYEAFDDLLRLYFSFGYLEFDKVDWDFSYFYRFDIQDNEGKFKGEKYFLLDYLRNHTLRLEIIDEVYGYHRLKFSGWSWDEESHQEFLLELSYENGYYITKEGV